MHIGILAPITETLGKERHIHVMNKKGERMGKIVPKISLECYSGARFIDHKEKVSRENNGFVKLVEKDFRRGNRISSLFQ
jgi:hypothetical protein